MHGMEISLRTQLFPRHADLGVTLKPYQVALKDAVDSMISHKLVGTAA